jgi:hypothetical protein
MAIDNKLDHSHFTKTTSPSSPAKPEKKSRTEKHILKFQKIANIAKQMLD